MAIWSYKQQENAGSNMSLLRILLLVGLFYALPVMAQTSFSVEQDQLIIETELDGGLLEIYLGKHNQRKPQQPSLLGQVSFSNGELVFTPSYPFQLGESYTAYFNKTYFHFEVPIPEDYRRAKVTAIFPSDRLIPANLLKFYIQFSQPISTIAYPHIDILDATGLVIERAILKDIPELWDKQNRLLCVWIEPGRIKQGLGPNQKLGPVLEAGKQYQIRISNQLLDQNGVPILETSVKDFITTERDEQKLDPRTWQITLPQKTTKEALVIHLNDQVDYSSSLSGLSLQNSSGLIVPGSWKLMENETVIQFQPDQVWQVDSYQLRINDSMEDLAGNTILRLFDQPIGQQNSAVVNRLPIEIK